jgi:hypothetical protein
VGREHQHRHVSLHLPQMSNDKRTMFLCRAICPSLSAASVRCLKYDIADIGPSAPFIFVALFLASFVSRHFWGLGLVVIYGVSSLFGPIFGIFSDLVCILGGTCHFFFEEHV